MTRTDLAFVSFKSDKQRFVPSMSIDHLLSSQRDLELTLNEAAEVYNHRIINMHSLIIEIGNYRMSRKPLPARIVWELGNNIFLLVDELEKLSLQIDGLYDHLERDLGAKRKWLEKVIILRRYVSKKELIPASLNWGKIEKGTRRKSERVGKGLPLT
jgi:hypothetical protein